MPFMEDHRIYLYEFQVIIQYEYTKKDNFTWWNWFILYYTIIIVICL